MQKIVTGLACAAFLIGWGHVSVAVAAVPDNPRDIASEGSNAGAEFKSLYMREWNWRHAQFGDEGARELPAHLPQVDAATQATRKQYWSDVLRQLNGIPLGQLSAFDRTNFAVYKYQIETLLAAQKFATWQMPFTSSDGFWTTMEYTATSRFSNAQRYLNYLSQLRDIPRYFDQQTANMRLGLARGFTQPAFVARAVAGSIAVVADAKGEDNILYTPFKNMPASIPEAQRRVLRAQALRAIDDAVVPAYAKLLSFMSDVYLRQARTTIDAYDQPDGKAFYQWSIYKYTTLTLTPEQIHKIGLEAVARIHKEMLQTIAETDFKGSYSDFLTFLRTDPRFYATSEQGLLKELALIKDQIDGVIGNFIGHLPRQRYHVVLLPESLAKFAIGGGEVGKFIILPGDLKRHELYSQPALTVHEADCGHATQLSLVQEFTWLPDFRRNSYISGYGEGWGLYCETLGKEMGIYDTPYKRFGAEAYQQWRAARLVIDTGLHAMHWTREQAIDYLHENTALSDTEVRVEVDRYITDPGQALAYYLGQKDILDQRARAEQALGAKFDIRNFNDAVLSTASVPLSVLNAEITRFIESGGKSPYANDWCAVPDARLCAFPDK